MASREELKRMAASWEMRGWGMAIVSVVAAGFLILPLIKNTFLISIPWIIFYASLTLFFAYNSFRCFSNSFEIEARLNASVNKKQ